MIRPLIGLPWLVVVIGLGLTLVALGAARSRPGHRRPWVLRGALVLVFGVVLLGPGVGSVPAPARLNDLEVLVVVDKTTSMSAQDWDGAGQRLDGVRRDLADLTTALPGSRFALVTFGKVTHTELPFTSDVAAFGAAAATIRREGIFYGAGSRVDRPLDQLTQTLATAEAQHPERRRILYLLTDGENTVDGPQRSFAGLAPLIDGGAVLGYGTSAGGKMQADDTDDRDDYLYDRDLARDAVSRIDEDNLRLIAAELGVDYAHREAPGGIDELTATIEPHGVESDEEVPARLPLGWAVALVLLGLGLVELRGHWRSLQQARREVIA